MRVSYAGRTGRGYTGGARDRQAKVRAADYNFSGKPRPTVK